MALRPVSDLGLVDPTDVDVLPGPRPAPRDTDAAGHERARERTGALVPVQDPAPPAEPPVGADGGEGASQEDEEAERAPSKPRRRPERKRSRKRTAAAPDAVPLADELTEFVQFMAAGELQHRLARASLALKRTHPRLRHQKTIIGALVWRYVDVEDPDLKLQLGELLDEFEDDDLAQVPGQVKVGANIPQSLKWRLDAAAVDLQTRHRRASAKGILSALIARHVDPADLDGLIELLEDYDRALRPRRRLSASDLAG